MRKLWDMALNVILFPWLCFVMILLAIAGMLDNWNYNRKRQ